MKIGLENIKDIYDSTKDTKEHISLVNSIIKNITAILIEQCAKHDASKLESPEKESFDKVTPKLKELTYGSDEYKRSLNEIQDALKHHYKNNRHHPEHFENGILDMNLVDILEMFADWAAASKRHDDGNIFKSIEHNSTRFKLGKELTAILTNTAKDFNVDDISNTEV